LESYKYLIVGGGMTADSAVKGIRKVDANGTIGLISQEEDPPYNRPPLSKALWKGKDLESIWRGTAEAGAALHLGRRATAIDSATRKVVDDRGETYSYQKLLLATGARPRRLENDGGEVIYFRTTRDYRALKAAADRGGGFVVIGGGYIGSELAAALRMNDRDVTMIFPEAGIGARVFPADLAEHLVGYYREKGVEVHNGEMVAGVSADGERRLVKLANQEEFRASAVVAGIGVMPNTQLAVQAGLAVDNGIVVNAMLQTSDPQIYAAGDVANFENPDLGKRMRVEHEDNANTMGEIAGRSMAGEAIRYTHLPYFYSDLFDLGYEAVGEVDSRLETHADWTDPYRKGVVYYLDQGRVRGVLLWNVWDQVDAARALIREPGPFAPDQLIGRLPA
jgi:3-phenylpropionate/trans-cinnamate dioxygenase ferredoxin reductase component